MGTGTRRRSAPPTRPRKPREIVPTRRGATGPRALGLVRKLSRRWPLRLPRPAWISGRRGRNACRYGHEACSAGLAEPEKETVMARTKNGQDREAIVLLKADHDKVGSCSESSKRPPSVRPASARGQDRGRDLLSRLPRRRQEGGAVSKTRGHDWVQRSFSPARAWRSDLVSLRFSCRHGASGASAQAPGGGPPAHARRRSPQGRGADSRACRHPGR